MADRMPDPEAARVAAERHAVSSLIHPDDEIWHFLATHPSLSAPGSAEDYYFDDGARSAAKFSELVADLQARQSDIRTRVFEFASGYGMVTRHLLRMSSFDVLSCDIHPAAVEFTKTELQGSILPSAENPGEFELTEKFDVVFALSLFSHMPKSSFLLWLRRLS